MKAAPFEYARPESLAQGLALLAEHGPDAKLIAGGQSLVPMMAMRLARPSLLIDIARLPELQHLRAEDDCLVVGGAVRQCVLESDPQVGAALPLLALALKWVGHPQTRNRGTAGGSIVHADPSAEIPLVACTLDASLVLRSAGDTRETPAREFFFAPMVTAIAPEQCLAEIRFPRWHEPRVGTAFEEVAIRHGDFALAAVAAQVAVDADGRVTRAALGVGGAGPVPLALPEVAEGLVGRALDEAACAEVAAALAAELDAEGDIHASADYRRHLARVLARRALLAAYQEACSRHE